MKLSQDVMEIIGILNDEGFAELAGEILTELSLGREIEVEDGEDNWIVSRSEIPDEDQLAEALNLINFKLVEPAKRLMDAESIASEFTENVRILFISGDGEEDPTSSSVDISAQDRSEVLSDLGRFLLDTRITDERA